MELLCLLMVPMVVAGATGAKSDSEENELDYGSWNYREGAERVNVASVPSVTRVLDAWGKRIFTQIKSALQAEPSALLPDYSRVRYLPESLDDLFREVSLLRMRVTELSQRLTSLEPLLRHYGYREKAERGEAARGGGAPRPERASSAGGPGPPRGSRLVRRGPGRTAGETQ
ncbi:hypothetical protein fugu_008541 [Takifugu bimaculatus]|uniref:Uncharacterized protein n=1 Tax=Takifugu bimaculatus TaxID=433685 RepID=A0A4Z2B5T8_9TELE|nr:hypothetical protein fugu_008541 [Takifugu bimaculatus]